MLCINFWNLEPSLNPVDYCLRSVISTGEAAKFIENWRRKGSLACVFKEISEADRRRCSKTQLCEALPAFGITLKATEFLDEPRLNVLMDAPFVGTVDWMFLDCYYTVAATRNREQRGDAPQGSEIDPILWPALSALTFVLERAP